MPPGVPTALEAWRLPVAGVGLALCVLAESVWPFRQPGQPRWRHYGVNLALALGNLLVLRLIWGGLLLTAASTAARERTGLFGMLGLAPGWSLVLTVLGYDALSYAMHVLYHRLPLLWRLHQVHHSDLDFDTTTASRFHVLEILLSTAVQTAAAAALGASPEGVVLFQMLLLAQAQLQHSNLRWPEGLDRLLRWVLVTPNMHRVHHSVVRRETDSNFATILSVWDRIGGTFRWGSPQETIRIGLLAYREPAQVTLPRLLAMPFRPVPAEPPPQQESR